MDKEIISKFLDSANSMSLFGKNLSLFKNNFQFVNAALDVYKKNKEVHSTDEEVENILKSLNILENLVITIPLTQDFITFSINYCSLISYWNTNISKNNNISTLCNVITRFCNYHMTSVEAIITLKNLIAQTRKINESGLSYVQLSKEYLDMIYKQLEENNEDRNAIEE